MSGRKTRRPMERRIPIQKASFIYFSISLLVIFFIPFGYLSTASPLNMDSLANQSDSKIITDPINDVKLSLKSIESQNPLIDSVIDQFKNTSEVKTSSASQKVGIEVSLADSRNLILSNETIPGKDYLYIYSTSPFQITNGKIYAKLPCDGTMNSMIILMVGSIQTLNPIKMNVSKDLSKPGYMCLYNSELGDVRGGKSNGNMLPISDIILYNSSDREVILPSTTSISILISKMVPMTITNSK